MEEKDLIKKLENIEIPELEMKSHRKNLKMALLNSDYFQERDFFQVLKRPLAVAVPVLVLLLLLGFNVIEPRLAEANALRLAMNNPEIRRLVEEKNMVLSEVKVSGKKAYILLKPQEKVEFTQEKDSSIKIEKAKENEIEGAIIEISLEQKEVTKIDPIEWEEVAPLDDNEKERAKEIAKENEILRDLIPKEAKLEKIKSSLPQKINLIAEDNKAKVIPQPNTEKIAKIHYTLEGKEWVVKVDLFKKKVEEIKYSLKNQNFKGRNNQ